MNILIVMPLATVIIMLQVKQVCAYELGIGIDKVEILPSETFSNANTKWTGGSITTELCALVGVVLLH